MDGRSGGANWYAYVNNDPVNWVDPWGLLPVSDSEAAYLAEMAGTTDGRTYGREMREMMSGWNASHSYLSVDWLPGSAVTSESARAYERLRIGSDYLSYQPRWYRSGWAGDVVSAGFYEVLQIQDANRVGWVAPAQARTRG